MSPGDDDREVTQPVRWRDLDAFGHVYHGEYLTLLDEARSAWFAGAPALRRPEAFVVARLEIDYLSPVSRDDGAVTVSYAVERLGRTSLTLVETMRAGSPVRDVARSRTVVVLWDPDAGTPRPLDDDERARLEPFLAT